MLGNVALWGWVVLYRGIAPQGAVFYSIGHRPMDYAVANPHHQALVWGGIYLTLLPCTVPFLSPVRAAGARSVC